MGPVRATLATTLGLDGTVSGRERAPLLSSQAAPGSSSLRTLACPRVNPPASIQLCLPRAAAAVHDPRAGPAQGTGRAAAPAEAAEPPLSGSCGHRVTVVAGGWGRDSGRAPSTVISLNSSAVLQAGISSYTGEETGQRGQGTCPGRTSRPSTPTRAQPCPTVGLIQPSG